LRLGAIGQRDVRWYIHALEESVLCVLQSEPFALADAHRKPGLIGVWVGEVKVCAIGVKICSRWVTMHGLALNVDTDLGAFQWITPCGIADKAVSSLRAILTDRGKPTPCMKDVKERLLASFAQMFEVDSLVRVTAQASQEALPVQDSTEQLRGGCSR